MIKTAEEKTKDYYDLLKEDVKYSKEFEGILRYLPSFYKLLCNIISDKKTNWYSRILVNCALAYLVLERDVINDKEGGKGYLDDLFLCSYVLKEIRDKISKEIILNNANDLDIEEHGEKLLNLIYDIHSKTLENLGGKENEILNFVGLSRFNALDLLCSNDKLFQIRKANKKLRLLYAMNAVIIQEFFDLKLELDHRRFKMFEGYITAHPEFSEIKRYIAFLEDHDGKQ
ncbi:MAG: DUF1232 domain-containing protein [Proteobacteria bacterium]|nr:DUF1232 domain-containing protein [Pseudomonadota bacterium]